ncbi:MAG TPA: hypothetical protein VKM72_09060 [Thermoanaerobaculia bacterium]|nr:hypothetical protein [Thermoanaerobaculia bacterium]
MRCWTAAAALLVLLLTGALPAAGDWVGERLCATGLPRDGEFGSAVAVGDGGTIAVGDFRHDVVYLFTWTTANGCRPADVIRGRAGEWFGFDLAIDGDWLLIGAPQSGGTGAVYLYDLKTESLKAIAVPGVQRGDEVGSSVALDRGTLAIGARGADDRADDRRGRVYVGPEGALTAVPTPPGLAQGAELGQSVALSGNTLVMGAPSPFRASGSPGDAWVYDVQSGELLLLAPPGGLEPEAAFGYAVAVDGERILVGAPLADRGGIDAGAVFRFEGKGRGPAQELDFPRRAGDQLGVAVALEEETAVAGARYAGGTRGAAYLLKRNGPAQTLEQTVPGGAQLGFSVAIRGEVVVVGAFREGGTGAAYRFEETDQEPPPPPPPPRLVLSAGPLRTSEAGGSASLKVRLAGPPPSANVTVTLITSDSTAGTVSPDRLTFTAANWESEQTVQVTGQDDALCDGTQSYEIRARTASADLRYKGLSGSVPAENADDELACVTAAMEVCTDGGGTVVYTITLANAAPGAPVPAELLDVLPPEVTVVTASADQGTAIADPIDNSVRWTGTVPATITIVAALDVPPGPEVKNHADVAYVRDDRGDLQTARTDEVVFVAGEVIPCPF